MSPHPRSTCLPCGSMEKLALAHCMLLPGPEAQQLATYIGWLLHRIRGGLVAGILFVLPGFVSILLLSLMYAGFQETTLVQALFFGLKPGEMLDGLGMAETTPGPLIRVVQFVGFMGAYRNPGSLDPMLAGVLGSVLTTWVTFVPCFLYC